MTDRCNLIELADAELAGALWAQMRHLGFSLADRAWNSLDLDIEVEVIR